MNAKSAQPQDKYVVRLPDGMRERIKQAAEANNRSMNAEIVATLEEAYPPPRSPYPFLDVEMLILQWHSGAWHFVDWDTWTRFRAGDASTRITENRDDGSNFFIVAVLDERGRLCNVITHHYKISDSGYRSAAMDYLTEEEIEELNELMIAQSSTEKDRERLNDLRDKMDPAYILPQESIPLLVESLSQLAPRDAVESLLRSRGIISG